MSVWGPAAGDDCSAPMIVPPTGVRVWLANGHTDMRRGINGLALQLQEVLQRDPHAGGLYVFRGRRGDLVKILWHDGLCQAAGARPLPVAVAGGRLRGDLGLPVRLHAGRDRLTPSAADLAAGDGWLTRQPSGGAHSRRPVWLISTVTPDPAPDDIIALRAALAAEQLARREAEARVRHRGDGGSPQAADRQASA